MNRPETMSPNQPNDNVEQIPQAIIKLFKIHWIETKILEELDSQCDLLEEGPFDMNGTLNYLLNAIGFNLHEVCEYQEIRPYIEDKVKEIGWPDCVVNDKSLPELVEKALTILHNKQA